MLNGSIKMAMEVEYSTRERHLAGQLFDYFCTTQSMKEILSSYTLLCDVLRLKPNRLNDFYPKLKAILSNNWKAQALFAKFDERANHKEYQKGKACSKTRVLIIGAGPAGLKMAIECQLLGAKVVLIEKRDEFSRNNVIHLWPFVIQDLNNLGAKTFYGKFCAGSINHISIRRLQFILLKMALLLGVEVHQCIAFDDLVEPEISEDDEITGWRALLQPREHPVSQYEFDVLIGADGRRNSLRGFEKNVLRTKLCIGITVNFINRNTEEEAAVNEIGGLSYIFAQQFFKDIESSTGIDLENITYYKDETHYFVMTAKKSSLIKKGVLLRDYLNVATLLSKENVSREALMNYALEAARTATKGQIPNMTFAVNHCAEPDIAIFDFSTSYSSENASIVYEVLGKRLLCQLIGDSLMEPFWPTGSGCARCFLSAMDASWAVRSWCQRPEKHPLLVIAERESIYRLLPQTTANNLQPNIPAYTLDPISRYSNLNTRCVTPNSVSKLYISDHPIPLDAEMPQRETGNVTLRAMLNWAGHPDLQSATCPKALWDIVMRYRHDLLPEYNEENYSLIYQLLEEKILPPLQLEYDLDDTPYRYLLGVYVAFKGEVAYVPSIALDQDSILALFQSMVSVPRPMPVLTNTTVAVPSINPNRRQTVDNRVSTNTADFIRKRIGKLDINDITKLARLMEGHDAISDSEYSVKHKEIHDQIIALLDPDESPDPQMVREAITDLLQGSSRSKVNPQGDLTKFFANEKINEKKSSRCLKGLDPESVKPQDILYFDESETNRCAISNILEKKPIKKLVRSQSDESPDVPSIDIINRRKNSDSMVSVRTGSSEIGHGIKDMRDLFEGKFDNRNDENNTFITHREDRKKMCRDLRWQQFANIIEGKNNDSYCAEPKKVLSIGNAELAEKRLKMAELLLGVSQENASGTTPPRNSGNVAFRMQRITDMIARNNNQAKLPKGTSRRKGAREMMKERVEKSLQLLTLEPLPAVSQTDLEHDYGLQQYRADAPDFDVRVKKLEKQLQHYDESAIEPIKAIGSGIRVAQLAAELNSTALPKPKPLKPKDLMRAIGKISQDDWQIKQIEGKINENRFGRPMPSAAERVPKWDREQFLNRQHRVQHGQTEDKWTAGDTIIKRVDTKLKDTGRPEQGRTSVKSLMAKFLDRPVPPVQVLQENPGLSRGAKRDVDRNPAIVQPGNAHPTNSTEAVDSPTGQDVDSIPNPASTPMSTEVVDRSIIGLEDSPTNQDLPSISTINESNTTRCYPVYNDSDDYQMDDDMLNYLNDVFESAPINMPSTSAYDGSASSLETASNRQQTRKKRPHKKIASSSSEMESDEEDSDSSDDDEKSSGTEVSTDSEFACEDIGVNIPPPAILVTEAPPHISPPQDYPLNRTKSAGGLATKRALELKRKYLLGESSPPAVRKSESTSQLDSKLEAFRINITEFQKMLHPATPTPQTGTPILSYQFTFEEKKPPPDIPDIIKNICNHVPVDLLTKGDSILDWKKPFRNERDPDLETDSLSDESSTSDTAPNRSVPRLEVHNEGGELIQLDSLILLNNAVEDKTYSRTTEEGPASLAEVSESSESCKDATTLALTETELSDWATEIVVIDDCGLDENGLRKRNKNPRSLSGPKLIQDPKNVETISSHVCGRDGLESELVVYSNAPEYLEFADEGDQDPTIESTSTPCNEGYMELVDDEYDPYSASRDRSINFIERVCSDTTIKPDTHDTLKFASNFSESLEFIDSSESKSGSLHNTKIAPESFSFYEKMPCGLNESNDSYSSSCALKNVEDNIIIEAVNDMKVQKESITLTEMSPPLLSMTDKNGVTVSYSTKNGNSLDDVSPPLVSDSISHSRSLTKVNYETKPIPGEKFKNIRNYSPAICRSASENLGGPRTKKTTSTDSNWSIPLNYKIPRARDSPYQLQSQLTKVEELKRQREEQTEVVRRLVLQRLGGAKLGKKSTSRSRSRVLPSSMTPPPVPPPPILPAPLLPDIFPEVPPRPTSQPRLSLSMQSSLSDPELNREQRSSKGFLKSISNYFNKHLGPKHKCESEPDLTTHPARPNERANTSRHTWYQPTATTPQSTPRPTVCASKASPLRETRVISPNFPRDRSSGTRIDTVNQQVDQRDRPESDVSEMLQPASPSAAAPTTAGNIRDKAREQRQKTIWIKKARRLERISIRENENQDHIVAQILDIRATEESRRSMEEAQRAMESMLRAKWGSVGE
ncbi:uncharacterized protein LOC123718999 isoform X2 [Pieris brassicae]|uniref:uncharacterized protein LOC123718999 isoform X2 n=1 Tax=Pieris brassicae TaxID=7116 RepID=UPI001E660FE6|nr:uncharacterized protein LOC123718999 isoform X2 [Pieris brassicae]